MIGLFKKKLSKEEQAQRAAYRQAIENVKQRYQDFKGNGDPNIEIAMYAYMLARQSARKAYPVASEAELKAKPAVIAIATQTVYAISRYARYYETKEFNAGFATMFAWSLCMKVKFDPKKIVVDMVPDAEVHRWLNAKHLDLLLALEEAIVSDFTSEEPGDAEGIVPFIRRLTKEIDKALEAPSAT